MKEPTLRLCEVIYVRQKQTSGWKWRPIEEEGERGAPSKDTYPLYYECVSAARANGYTVNVKLKCS